jgi:hypothetical protein
LSCDSSENQALAARFNINLIPSLYLIKERKVWIYTGSLSHDHIVNFVYNGYKIQSPMSILESPLGPIGSVKGLLTKFGIYLYSLPKEISDMWKVSNLFAQFILTISTIFVFLITLFLLVLFSLKRETNK